MKIIFSILVLTLFVNCSTQKRATSLPTQQWQIDTTYRDMPYRTVDLKKWLSGDYNWKTGGYPIGKLDSTPLRGMIDLAPLKHR